MASLVIESYVHLLRVEFLIRLGDLESVHAVVRRSKIRRSSGSRALSAEELCHAMDYACVFYLKRVACLQRSAATTLLLRRRGFAAEMVIGAQMLPFKSHAWVEIDHTVVNDKPYMLDVYKVLERC